MKPTPPAPTLLPARVDSSVLAKFRLPGEPLILVKLAGVGNSAPYDFHDKGTRSFIFRHESQHEGHILRVPLHLWQENKARLAHDLMDQRRLPHAIIVTLEEPPPSPPSPLSAGTQMGATDTRTETRNVVGPGSAPTVAPTRAREAATACPQPKSSAACPQREDGAACPQAAAASDGAPSPASATSQTSEPPQPQGRAACPQAAAMSDGAPSPASATSQTSEPPQPQGRAACPQAAAAEAPAPKATPPALTTQRELPSKTRPTVAAPTTAATSPTAAAPTPLTVAATTLQTETPPLIAGRPLREAAYDLLEAPRRLKALAALLGVPEPALRAAIDHPGSSIELAPAGTVRRKA